MPTACLSLLQPCRCDGAASRRSDDQNDHQKRQSHRLPPPCCLHFLSQAPTTSEDEVSGVKPDENGDRSCLLYTGSLPLRNSNFY
ncbi:hypothetical protein BAE44_0006873 [Dichanthelium oligosanthes]|uniref:Uncharacterized protein n=1 Tax=Dichanthelium oligosanthes TaxID=888268 RepID=A0A1E5W4A0_9POAL|nr:hypothetical protein BAE44_0006873 [Dichanthelium oligosanthes]